MINDLRTITLEQQRQYETEGYLIVKGLFQPEHLKEIETVTANPYWPEYDSVRCPRFARNRVLSEEIRGKVSTDDFPSACR